MGSGKPRVKLPVLDEWQTKAVAALDDSIQHWDRLATQEKPEESPGGHYCQCCQDFFRPRTADCGACPISARTGRNSCAGTPWRDAYLLWNGRTAGTTPEFRAAAAIERDYLIETRDMVLCGEVRPK